MNRSSTPQLTKREEHGATRSRVRAWSYSGSDLLAAPVTAVRTAAISSRATAAGVVATAAVETSVTAIAGTIALTGEVDTDDTAVEFLVVQFVKGSVSLLGGGEGDETESTATASITVLDDNRVVDSAKLLKASTETLISSVPGKAPNEELRHF